MAFPTGWNRKCALTIQHGQVPADQTAFPVLITEATLPSEILVSGGGNAAQSDGGDIRFSSDSAGATQLACEIVLWDQSGGKAEIWVPVNILTASDVTIYVWYNAGGGLSQPAVNASFGAQAVWDSNYKSVCHFGTPSSLAMADSKTTRTFTGHGSSSTAPTAGTGKVGGGGQFTQSLTQYFTTPDTGMPSGTAARSVEFWANNAGYSTNGNVVVSWGTIGTDHFFGVRFGFIASGAGRNYLQVLGWSDDVDTGANYATSTWYHVVVTFSATSAKLYVNGSLIDTSTRPWNTTLDGTLYIGDSNFGGPFNGLIDELRISDTARSGNWVTTVYNNQSSPSAFVVAGTPSGSGGGGGGSQLLIHPGMLGGMRPLMLGGCNG